MADAKKFKIGAGGVGGSSSDSGDVRSGYAKNVDDSNVENIDEHIVQGNGSAGSVSAVKNIDGGDGKPVIPLRFGAGRANSSTANVSGGSSSSGNVVKKDDSVRTGNTTGGVPLRFGAVSKNASINSSSNPVVSSSNGGVPSSNGGANVGAVSDAVNTGTDTGGGDVEGGSSEFVGGDLSSGVSDVDDSFGEFFDDLDEYGQELARELASSGEGSVDDGVSSDDSFDEQFAEFFGDDEDVVGGGDSTVDVGGEDVSSLLPAGVVEDLAQRREARKSPERVERTKRRVAKKTAARLKKNSGSRVYKEPIKGLETKKAQRGPREVLVDGEGVWRKPGVASSAEEFSKVDALFNNLVGAVEAGADVHVSDSVEAAAVDVNPRKINIQGKVFYPIVSSGSAAEAPVTKARLNARELEFYRSLQSSRSEVIDSQVAKEVLRRPTSGSGSTAVARAQKVLVGASDTSLRRSMGAGVKRVDVEILQFLAKFRYATHVHLSRLWGVTPNTALKHLQKLRAKGLVDRVSLWGTDPIWVCTNAGMLLSGYDLPIVSAKNMSYQLIPHQFTVNHIAANLWGGQLNVLDFDTWPLKNRVDVNGDLRFGEELVSETELHSSFTRVRGTTGASVFRGLVKDLTDSAFKRWEAAGGAEAGVLSPEFERGNEFMWILFPPAIVRRAYHIPDLVLRRPRNADGSPESIAIEIETVETKSEERYMPALKAYNYDKQFYKRVIWVCKTNASNKAIVNASKQLDLWRDDRVEVVSITTDDGVFSGRDLWKL